MPASVMSTPRTTSRRSPRFARRCAIDASVRNSAVSSVRSSSCCSACSFLMPRSVTYVNDRSSFLMVFRSTTKSISLSVAHVRSSDASTMVPSLSRATQPPRCSMRSIACTTAGGSNCRRDWPEAPPANETATTTTRLEVVIRSAISLCPAPRAGRVETPVDLSIWQRLLDAGEPLFGELRVIEVEVFHVLLLHEPWQRLVGDIGAIELELRKSRVLRQQSDTRVANRCVIQVQRCEPRQLRDPRHAFVRDARLLQAEPRERCELRDYLQPRFREAREAHVEIFELRQRRKPL